MSNSTTPLKLDLVSQAFKANPYPTYAHLRTSAPVAFTQLPDGRHAWLISRYADVMAALRDARLAKDRRTVTTPQRMRFERLFEPIFRSLQFNMLDLDPPDHTRLRALVHKAFTPRLIEPMRGRVQALADELLDAVASRGEMDLIRDYALPLPMTVITEILGVPARDRGKFHRWSNALISADNFSAT